MVEREYQREERLKGEVLNALRYTGCCSALNLSSEIFGVDSEGLVTILNSLESEGKVRRANVKDTSVYMSPATIPYELNR